MDGQPAMAVHVVERRNTWVRTKTTMPFTENKSAGFNEAILMGRERRTCTMGT